jgi:hypothetical protein
LAASLAISKLKMLILGQDVASIRQPIIMPWEEEVNFKFVASAGVL